MAPLGIWLTQGGGVLKNETPCLKPPPREFSKGGGVGGGLRPFYAEREKPPPFSTNVALPDFSKNRRCLLAMAATSLTPYRGVATSHATVMPQWSRMGHNGAVWSVFTLHATGTKFITQASVLKKNCTLAYFSCNTLPLPLHPKTPLNHPPWSTFKKGLQTPTWCPVSEKPPPRKSVFSCPDKACHKKTREQCASDHEQCWWSTKLSNPPTHPKQRTPPPHPGGVPALFPTSGENQTNPPTHPP